MKISNFGFACIFASMLFISSCGSSSGGGSVDPLALPGDAVDPGGSDNPTRSFIETSYQSVGMITVNGYNLCSGVILKHGVFVSAKHCFRSGVPGSQEERSRYALHFPKNGIVGNDSVKVNGSSITEVTMDGEGNDIAYMIYDGSVTKDSITIDTTEILRETLEFNKSVNLVGFPSPKDNVYRRLVSHQCQTTERTGYLPEMTNDPGYDGLLYDTNCQAWFGNSGGPIFYADKTGEESPTAVIGVVTHSFDVTEDGDLDSSKLGLDDYGKHVTTTNLSPFSQANKLDDMLALGVD